MPGRAGTIDSMEADDPMLTNKARRVSSFFRESSVDLRDPLVKQRKESLVPFIRSPFTDTPDPSLDPGELSVSPAEVPWSDLLLEIAMTTAFASLTDGTPILEGANVASYLSFFALVWWVWASQVAYNVRFRQSDWIHRAFIFFQVFVFCALAAFTNNFDVTNGIVDNSKEEQQIQQLRESDTATFSRPFFDSQKFRDDRLPTLNVRGISMTIGFSRFILLTQYFVAFYHSIRRNPGRFQLSQHTALLVHIGSLIFSSTCFFTAFGVIGKDPDKDDQITKLVLWYFPLLLEVATHYLAISRFCRGRVRYNAGAIIERSATVFVIILGGGLDKITNGFQYIVGNVSIAWQSLGLIFCGVVTFLLLFSLFFGTSEPDEVSSRRAISLFFFQFFYLSAIIVTLQGIAAMLRVGNLGDALEIPLDFLRQSKNIMEIKGFPAFLNESDYSSSNIQYQLEKQGVPMSDLLDFVNFWTDFANNETEVNRFDYPFNALLQMDIYIIEVVLSNLESFPDSGLLLAKMDAFYDPDPSNFTLVNNQTFSDIVESVIISNATPALWFYAAGGSVLVTLGLMGLIRQWPRDRYEWGQTISRLLMGSAIIAFTAIDIRASAEILTDDFHYEGSRIWYLATHSWILPPYALALLIEQIIELILLRLAGRKLSDFGSSTSALTRSLTRAGYARTGTSEHDPYAYGTAPMRGFHSEGFDLYAPYDPDNKAYHRPLVMTPPSGAPSFNGAQKVDLPVRLRPGQGRRQTSESSYGSLVTQ